MTDDQIGTLHSIYFVLEDEILKSKDKQTKENIKECLEWLITDFPEIDFSD